MTYPPMPGPGENEQPGAGWTPPPAGRTPYGSTQSSSEKATWALAAGIFGLFCCGLVSIAAIVLGAQAKAEIAATGGLRSGEGQARAGWVLGIVGCVVWTIGAVLWAVLFSTGDFG